MRKLLLTAVAGVMALSFIPAQAASVTRSGTIENPAAVTPYNPALNGPQSFRDDCVFPLTGPLPGAPGTGSPDDFLRKCEKDSYTRQARCYYLTQNENQDLPESQTGSATTGTATGLQIFVFPINASWQGYAFSLTNKSAAEPQNSLADFDITFWSTLGTVSGCWSTLGAVQAGPVHEHVDNPGYQCPHDATCIGDFSYTGIGNESGYVPGQANTAIVSCTLCKDADWEFKVTGLP